MEKEHAGNHGFSLADGRRVVLGFYHDRGDATRTFTYYDVIINGAVVVSGQIAQHARLELGEKGGWNDNDVERRVRKQYENVAV